jgi:hypothetical protein
MKGHEKIQPSIAEITEAVVEIFEKCRETPNSHFEEAKFLLFLTEAANTKALKTRHGHAAYIKFYHTVEDHFQIYIGDRKMRTDWRLEDFCAYVSRAIKRRKSSAGAAEYYNERMMGCVFALSFMVLPFIALALRRGELGYWIAGILGLIYVVLCGLLLKDYWRYRKMARTSRG